MKIEHVVFDFDGVIIDSERKKFVDLRAILKENSYVLSDSKFNDFIGKKRGHFLQEIGVPNTDEIMKIVHKKDLSNDDLLLVEGLLGFLKFLQQKSIKMHIATGSSKDFVSLFLQKYAITEYFSEIITGDEIT